MNYENRKKVESTFYKIDTAENKISLLNNLESYITNGNNQSIYIRWSAPDGISHYTQIDISDEFQLLQSLIIIHRQNLQFKILEAKETLDKL